MFFLFSNFIVSFKISSLILVLVRNLECMCLVFEVSLKPLVEGHLSQTFLSDFAGLLVNLFNS